jgi:NAD(P)-dependent dehydrogenase (short-subunit alcohol dehydrogenase family)
VKLQNLSTTFEEIHLNPSLKPNNSNQGNTMTYNLLDKVVIITGANSGIGKAAAIQLAQAGATVILACRSLERSTPALEEVRFMANSNRVDLMQVDMSSQASIRQFTKEFLARYSRLDVLIHNAANFDLALKKPVLTDDGIETIFATNHLGPFLLTQLLLGLLKASAPSRVITVASKGLMTFPLLDIEFDNLNGERKFSPTHAYYHAKLAQVIFTYDLAKRLKDTGVTVNCVRVTNVAIPDERLAHIPKWLLKLYSIKRKFSITTERQAETYIYLAADSHAAKVTGGYWNENNQQVKSSRNSYRVETWDRLWNASAQLAGLEEKK